MTAVNIAVQKHAVHLICDGLAYDKDGTVIEISSKCWALPSLNAAVACMGPSLAGIVTVAEFTRRFSSFDEMIDCLEASMPKIYAANMALLSGSGIPDMRVQVVGWSESRSRPEAYSINCVPPESVEYWQQKVAGQIAQYGEDQVVSTAPFKLVALDGVTFNPPPADGLTFEQCGFRPSKNLAESLDPEVDMVVLLQMQRLAVTPMRPGLPAASKVGGHALLTSIDASGIRQRIVYRWPNDKVGEVIAPERDVDWKTFRRELKGRRRWWR